MNLTSRKYILLPKGIGNVKTTTQSYFRNKQLQRECFTIVFSIEYRTMQTESGDSQFSIQSTTRQKRRHITCTH